ncbi:Dam family site-specific DNA-(adenine-N6)-methyltransferase [Billgrantia pellis]|uniref:site-specific DNA-methyltransferase (adenine-specific) n=1 Tax=Billgrantia pellis TaxID=2606936 RepID=A0A7V7KG32_9GAMM|nr:Dam family site-specific DNA-(adenine-N6)-methyltransferase [Halomonas pellis]KAA0010073.1 Dam family site-specific DNA-(adenine-N6)-methyltransferase [Halomonas pellis]
MTRVTSTTEGVIPFLRWAGGKRWLAPDLAPLIAGILKRSKGTYFEPFLGSGAVFFAVAPQRAELSDINEDLINAYHWVRRDPALLAEIVSSWEVSAETYYQIRSQCDVTGVVAAARFVYLNRTCYGGIHRTNRLGHFNTPYGGGSRRPDALWTDGILDRCSEVLGQDVALRCQDFEPIVDRARDGDVVFCDPTYSDVTKSQFDRYGATVFNWSDQVRLAHSARRAAERGAVAIISNGAFAQIADLYPDAYRIRRTRKKSIGYARVHGTDDEFLFVLDPLRRRRIWKQLGKIENRVHAVKRGSCVTGTATLEAATRKGASSSTDDTTCSQAAELPAHVGAPMLTDGAIG